LVASADIIAWMVLSRKTKALPCNQYSRACFTFSQSQGSLTVSPALLSAMLL